MEKLKAVNGVIGGDNKLSFWFVGITGVWLSLLDALSPFMNGGGSSILRDDPAAGLAVVAGYFGVGLVLWLLLRMLNWSIVLLILVGTGGVLSFYAFVPLYVTDGQVAATNTAPFILLSCIFPLILLAPYALLRLKVGKNKANRPPH